MNMQHATIMVAGRPHRGFNVECKCGVTTQVPVNDVKGSPSDQGFLTEQFVGRKLEAKGWKILKQKDGHACPGCVANADTPRAKASAVIIVKDLKDLAAMTPVVKNAHFAGPSTVPVRASAEPVAELTRADRRIIISKLEEVYVDEKVGYSAGWTDAKVASDLGVPRAWVSTLRHDNFGPEGNEEIKTLLTQGKALLEDIRVGIKTAAQVNSSLVELNRRAEKIERTMIEIEKGLRA